MIGICISAGIATRISYKDYSVLKKDKIDLFAVGSGEVISEDMKDIEISDVEDESKIVVRAKYTGERSYLYMAVLSKVEIIKVYKGKESMGINERYIYVYEPSFFNFEKEYYMTVGGCTLMREKEEYVLFLKNKSFPEVYQLSEEEKKEYVLTTNNSLSKYLISDSYQNETVLDNLKYGEIKKYEVAVQKKEELELYNAYKSDVLKKYVNVTY